MANDLAMNINTADLVIKNNDLLIINNAERVAQQILITLREWLGEWFLDISKGVPYLEYILIKNPNIAHIQQIITEKIMSVEGVTGVNSVEVSFQRAKRVLEVEYEAVTDYGILSNLITLGYKE